jgi:23S rRNA (guanosine2251-2'-O)-methyltransferase
MSYVRIYGINPVTEALRAGRVTALQVSKRADGRMRELLALAEQRGVPIRRVEPNDLDRLAPGGVHQGVVGELKGARMYDVADLVHEAPAPALLVVLDGIEDPHNFGAILRTVDAAGAHGVIRQTRRAAALGNAAAKASAGAVAHVKIADVVNIARAVEELKELGIWTVGLAGDAPVSYDRIDLKVPVALVLGAEGAGLRRLVRERCDFLMKIPMAGHIASLNVSVAAGIALFEAVRQRAETAGLRAQSSGLKAQGSRLKHGGSGPEL